MSNTTPSRFDFDSWVAVYSLPPEVRLLFVFTFYFACTLCQLQEGLKIQISLAPRRTGSHGARSLSNRGKQFPSPMAFATSFMCAVFNPPQTD